MISESICIRISFDAFSLQFLTLTCNMVFYFPWPSHTFIFSFGFIASSLCCVYSRRRSRSRGQMRNQATTPGSPSEPPLTAYNTRIHQHTPIDSSTGTTYISSLAPSQPPAFLRSASASIHNRSPLPRRTAFNRSPLQPKLDTRSSSPHQTNSRSPLRRLRDTVAATS